jgi:ferritin-like metal-binding protein YciE
MAQQTPQEAICRYLEDAIAAENNFEHQLRAFATESDQPELKALFLEHADETALQQQRLTARLEALGGKPSGWKGFMANLFGLSPKTAQAGHDPSEKGTQDLMMAYAVEHSEIAMYEALAAAAETCGDTETAALARSIQLEERRTADRVWAHLAPAARQSFGKVTGGTSFRQAA